MALTLLCASSLVHAADKPNILFILTDDMGYADVSCNGGKLFSTPNIDRLATEGLRFTQFYVAAPICSPSRAGLLTGMYPARWKIKTFLQSRAGNRAAGQVDFLDPKAPSMVRAFKNAGYATAHIGKWHLGGGRDVTNAPKFAAYGYDEHVGTYESPEPDPNITGSDWIWSPKDKVKRWDRSSYFVEKTLDFLKRKKGQPCFVNFWPDDVHTPWVPKDAPAHRGKNRHESKEELKLVLSEYDRQVGRLLEGLKNLGLAENTIVIFASDNGPGPDFPGHPRSLGMRGQKGSLYEGGTRMPFIVRWPGKVPAHRVDEKSLLHSVDLFPSLCALAGVPLPTDAKFDGEDMSKALLGENVDRKNILFWEFGRRSPNKRSDKDHSPTLAAREGKWKLLVNDDGTSVELYDLEADRNETKNVAKENAKVTQRLEQAALQWKKTLP